MSLPELEEVLATATVVRLPMHVRFRGVMEREAVLLHGPAGWGEFSPFLEYGDAEASRWLACALEAGWEGLPTPVRTEVPVNGTVPAVAASDVGHVLARYDGVGTVKVKVAECGQGLEDDVARVAEVRRLAPEVRIRVDANQGWDHEQALTALQALAPYGLEYAEQPVPGIEGLARLREELDRRGLPVLIAADEAVRKESDPLAVARAGAADLIIVKAQTLGGPRRVLRLVAEAGLPAVVSSALDTSVGLAVGASLAAALPQLPYACGLGTASLFDADVLEPPYAAHGGVLTPGAVKPDPERLEALRVAPEREAFWRERITRAHALLAG